jgi:putative tricarboxylic transport membrane protein
VLKDLFRQKGNVIRSSILGIVIGALPGTGASIASVLCYDQAKKASPTPEKFGTGMTEGIVASEAGNNATAGGSLAPTLALGVPGDATAAIMMGALILHGIQPGPEIINKHPALVYGVFMAFFIAHFFMLLLMLYGIRLFVHITRLPLYVLAPSVLVLCAVGAFAVKNSFFDIWTLLIFGCLGYFMDIFKYPLAPFILGVILAPLGETSLVQAIQLSDDVSLFVTRPISLGLLICAAISLLYPFWQARRKKAGSAAAQPQP